MSDQNRRKHERLHMTEHAIAVDGDGREIGKVVQAGGGGVTVDASSAEAAARIPMGERLQITIFEPGSQTRNTIDMVLRHRVGIQLGFEFVTGKSTS
jgi:hypothetical protein